MTRRTSIPEVSTVTTVCIAFWFSSRAHALRRSLKCSGSGCRMKLDTALKIRLLSNAQTFKLAWKPEMGVQLLLELAWGRIKLDEGTRNRSKMKQGSCTEQSDQVISMVGRHGIEAVKSCLKPMWDAQAETAKSHFDVDLILFDVKHR